MNDTPSLPTSPAEQLLAQRKAFETAVTLRAWADPAFAEQLSREPAAAINAAFGIELPAELDVQLHHESPTTLHLALPPAPVFPADEELTEDDLERVAGGAGFAGGMAITAATGVGMTVATASLVITAASAVATVQVTRQVQ